MHPSCTHGHSICGPRIGLDASMRSAVLFENFSSSPTNRNNKNTAVSDKYLLRCKMAHRVCPGPRAHEMICPTAENTVGECFDARVPTLEIPLPTVLPCRSHCRYDVSVFHQPYWKSFLNMGPILILGPIERRDTRPVDSRQELAASSSTDMEDHRSTQGCTVNRSSQSKSTNIREPRPKRSGSPDISGEISRADPCFCASSRRIPLECLVLTAPIGLCSLELAWIKLYVKTMCIQ